SFIPLVIASVLAASVHAQLMGAGPMFTIGAVDFGIPTQLPFYIVLGLLCGLAAVVFSKALYWIEDQFERLPIDRLWWPAIGALGLGVIGYFVPRVLGVGYNTISDILNNQLPLQVLLVVMIFKAIALIVSLGSGTSGGLLAPMFMAGAALGAVFAIVVNRIFPGANLSPGAFALVAMAAVFGSAARATFTFIIFAFEITRDYNAILPLMLACVIADGIALVFMRNSIMTEKLARRGLRIHLEYESDPLQQTTVSQVMITDVPTISSEMKVTELADRIARNDSIVTRHQALPILDPQNHLVGIITRGDVLQALDQNLEDETTVLDAGSDNLIVTHPDEPVHDAINKMLQYDIGRLPVVDRNDPQRMIGYLGRSGVMQARLRRLEEEHVREPGWLKRTTEVKVPVEKS
ncbi:MAG TPA: chloride channel protein, partial [Anaerolineae bacterium]|nr:chloride channel protein [Anaerolineae bacterium]